MVLPSTIILTMDNSGARRVKCIKVYSKPGLSYGTVGDKLLVIVKKLRNRGLIRVSRGEIHSSIITRITKNIFRKKQGYFFKFDFNTIVMLTNKNLPIGTRIFGPCSKELRNKGYNRVTSLCSNLL